MYKAALQALQREGNSFDELLLDSTYANNLTATRLFLILGADVNTQDEFGNTPIIIATRRGHCEIIGVLVRHGGDLNARNDVGVSALHAALTAYQMCAFETLIRQGADVDTQEDYGFTPLHTALMQGNMRAVRILLLNRARIDLPNQWGVTANGLAQSLNLDITGGQLRLGGVSENEHGI